MRFFFDVEEGETVLRDEDGASCASADHAVRQAILAASQMSADLHETGSLSVIVRDGERTVATVTILLRISMHRRK